MQKLQNKSIAVVGNGGSLIGSDSGEKIDSCDIVIRFNNYDTSLKYRKDVGRKTDIWCNTFYRDIKYRDDHPRIMCPLPLNKKEYLSIYSATNLSFLNEKCSNIEFMPEKMYVDLCVLMGGQISVSRIGMSSGLCLIYWLKSAGVNITMDNLFGFDFFCGENHHYFEESPTSLDHPQIEKEIIKKILTKNENF